MGGPPAEILLAEQPKDRLRRDAQRRHAELVTQHGPHRAARGARS
jgi:hypothetical protein